MKKVLCLILSVLMLISCFSFSVFAQDEISIVINGKKLTMDQNPVIIDGRTLVPLRAIFEGLGAQVEWDDSVKTAIGKRDGKEIKIQINNTLAKVNGAGVTLDVPAQLINSRTMVPVRFISEALGEKVDWDDATKTVIITSNNALKEWNFDNISSFELNKDFVMGASYDAKNVSLSKDVDHTTGSGQSLKMANRTIGDYRVKFVDAFSNADLGKTFTISAYVYGETNGTNVSLGVYGAQGTPSAFTPAAASKVNINAKEWTIIEITYKHENAEITQIGICQAGKDATVIETLYIDDIKITEGGKTGGSEEYRAVKVTDGHRPVPTSFTTGKGYDDLIYYSYGTKTNDELLAALPEGETIVTNDDLINAVATVKMSEYGTIEVVDVEGMPFKKAVRATTSKMPENSYGFQLELGTPLEGKAESGDTLLLKVYMRTLSGGDNEAQNGKIQVVVEENGGAHAKSLTGDVSNGLYWKEFYFPLKFTNNYTRATVRLGFYLQTVEFGGYEIINYKDKAATGDLPSDKTSNYPGLEKDAAWRREAWDRIEKIRKGDFKVIVKDKDGNIVPNAKVDVNMYEHEFEFGTAVNDLILKDERYKQVVQTNFNTAVSESNTKWAQYEKDKDHARNMLQMAKDIGIKNLRGHVLMWDRADVKDGWVDNTCIPKYLRDVYDDKDKVQSLVKEHIDSITGELKDLIPDEWDVMNEACSHRVLLDMYGDELITEWFKMAREAMGEDADLYYNDFKTNEEIFNILDVMVKNNTDFDGIGLQSHFKAITHPENVIDFYKNIAKYGKKIKITEFDVATNDELAQAGFLRDMLIAAFSMEEIEGFIVWGFKGGAGDKYVLYYSDFQEKAGLSAWQDLIYNKWWTKESGTTDATGTFATRGYYGDYDITVSANGKTKTVSAPFYKGNDNTLVITLD